MEDNDRLSDTTSDDAEVLSSTTDHRGRTNQLTESSILRACARTRFSSGRPQISIEPNGESNTGGEANSQHRPAALSSIHLIHDATKSGTIQLVEKGKRHRSESSNGEESSKRQRIEPGGVSNNGGSSTLSSGRDELVAEQISVDRNTFDVTEEFSGRHQKSAISVPKGEDEYHFPGFAGTVAPFMRTREFIVRRIVELSGLGSEMTNQILKWVSAGGADIERRMFLDKVAPTIDDEAQEMIFQEISLHCEMTRTRGRTPLSNIALIFDDLYFGFYQQYIRQDPLIYALLITLRSNCFWRLVLTPEMMAVGRMKKKGAPGSFVCLSPHPGGLTVTSSLDMPDDKVWSRPEVYVGFDPPITVKHDLNPQQLGEWNTGATQFNIDYEEESVIVPEKPRLSAYSKIGAALLGSESWDSELVQEELSQLFHPDIGVASEFLQSVRMEGRQEWRKLYECHIAGRFNQDVSGNGSS